MAAKKNWLEFVQTPEGRRAWIRSAIRRAHGRWPVAVAADNSVKIVRFVPKKSGIGTKREVRFVCNSCKQEFPKKATDRDHVSPVVPETGWVDWNTEVDRMFCKDVSGYARLCKSCHKAKSKLETAQRASARRGDSTGNAAGGGVNCKAIRKLSKRGKPSRSRRSAKRG